MSSRMSIYTLALVVSVATLLLSGVAVAGVENNPNVFPAENLECDNGFTSDHLLIIGRTGHVPPGNSGVATKVDVFVPGPGWITLFDVPGRGLNQLTTHCAWTAAGGAPAFRGEILLRGNLR